MKTIFITIYDGDTEKNVLRTDIFKILKEAGHKILLLIRSEKRLDYYRQNFEDKNVFVEFIPPAMNKIELIFHHICWNSVPTYSVFLRRHDLYLVHKNSLRYAMEKLLGFLGRFKFYRWFLRFIYNIIPDDYAANLFEKYKPDLVFSPNMFSAEDCRILRVAKKRGIKTATTVKSWDVLTTKAFTRVLADLVLVFNGYNKQEAMELGDYSEEKIKIIGFPQFDIYTNQNIYLSREEFFKKIGADPNKKLILFAVPGDWKNPYTHEVMLGINKAIEDGKIKQPVQVLARFHPKYPATGEQLTELNHFIKDRPGTYFEQATERSLDTSASTTFKWTFTNEDIIHLANSIFHSDITINTESTMTLDAAALDKSVILVGYDGFQKLDYWHSILRNYDRNHFQYVMKTGGARLAKTPEEMVEYINMYLEKPNLDKAGRQELRDKLIYKVDGNAGRRAAEAVLDLLEK